MRFRLLAAFIFLFLLSPAAAQAEDVAIVFSNTGYMPFGSGQTMTEGTSYHGIGMFVDLLEAFGATHPEHSILWTTYPSVRSIKMLEEGKAEVYSMASPRFSSQFRPRYEFSEPLWTTEDAVYVRADSPDCPATPEALRGAHPGRDPGLRIRSARPGSGRRVHQQCRGGD